MDIVGYIAVILALLIVLVAIVVVAISFPDIRRYLRIRNM